MNFFSSVWSVKMTWQKKSLKMMKQKIMHLFASCISSVQSPRLQSNVVTQCSFCRDSSMIVTYLDNNFLWKTFYSSNCNWIRFCLRKREVWLANSTFLWFRLYEIQLNHFKWNFSSQAEIWSEYKSKLGLIESYYVSQNQ